MKQFDFISIGDVTTDVFIRIEKANVHVDNPLDGEQLCVINGAKIPYEFAKEIPAVGNSANAAVSATRLGLSTAFVSNVGDDPHGVDDIRALKGEGVDTKFITVHPGKTSNYHYVLWYKADRTILIKHEAYEYVLPDIGEPKWVYVSSVGENTLPYQARIVEYLQAHPSIKLAFQPGSFQIKVGYEALKGFYERADLFFCNVEEARLILKDAASEAAKLPALVSARGPKISVITDGPKGAYVFDGTHTHFMPPYPDPAPPYERTGAGDAFASTFAAALALGLTVKEAMRWAPVNSMSVVQKIGAQEGLLTRKALEGWLAKAPAEYAPRVIA
ncbi:MAG: carbohydrate kinase family protein [bacterium]|nr:carbohydrate kinase family protein [bacterium]